MYDVQLGSPQFNVVQDPLEVVVVVDDDELLVDDDADIPPPLVLLLLLVLDVDPVGVPLLDDVAPPVPRLNVYPPERHAIGAATATPSPRAHSAPKRSPREESAPIRTSRRR